MLALWIAVAVVAGVLILLIVMTRGQVLGDPSELVLSGLLASAIITAILFAAIVPFVILLLRDPYFRVGFAAQFAGTVPAGDRPAIDTPSGAHEETVK